MRKNKSLHSGILYIRGSDFFVCGKELRETWNVKITMKTSMEGTAEKTKEENMKNERRTVKANYKLIENILYTKNER